MSVNFRFSNTDTLGSADADEDYFLKSCFVDTGILKVLLDTEDPRRLIVGRTGVGKTALLRIITENADNVINIPPDTLALSYISNSTILKFLDNLGVKLDIFYKLLWRHVFTVELLKYHFKLDSPQTKENLVQRIFSIFRDKSHERALKYLEKWGSSFWQDTDYRIKELTTKLETELKEKIGAKIPNISYELGEHSKITEEEKQEVIHRAQEVVNNVQIKELSEILSLVDTILNDPQKKHYILIDKLDEQWVDDGLRYNLIRALIETVRDFKKVKNAKIIIALRRDLIERVFRITRDSGFQEEKYETLYLGLTWSKDSLKQLLNSRIYELANSRKSKKQLTYKDILPIRKNSSDTIDYILSLTLMRPRDVIIFFNYCIELSDKRSFFSMQIISQAEGEYSRNRLRSLADEWFADYPNLMNVTNIIKTKPAHFTLLELDKDECENFALNLLMQENPAKDVFYDIAHNLINCGSSISEFRKIIMAIFYKVGLIGIKLEQYETTNWSYNGKRSVSSSEITDKSRITVHNGFRRALGIKDYAKN